MNESWFMPWAPLVGRLLIGGMFVMAGVQKFTALAATAGYIASVGLPFPELLAPLSGALELVAGLSLIVGYKIQWAREHLSCSQFWPAPSSTATSQTRYRWRFSSKTWQLSADFSTLPHLARAL